MRARSEGGFTLVEVLIAMTLMSVGIAATLSVFGSAGRTTNIAQGNEVATQQAQATVDQLSTTSYDKVGLTSTPASSTDPKNPANKVSGSTLQIKSGLTESFVLSTDSGQSQAAVDPTPQSFSVGVGGSTVTGKVYRYVTWRDETCQSGTCDGTQNTKRITVAVTLDATGTNPTQNPLWITEVLTDPSALPPGSKAPGSSSTGGNTVTAEDFYLYDTSCALSTRQTPSANHATDNTASTGYASSTSSSNYAVTDFSTCENATASKQPDLMGTTVPSGASSTPLYKYSSDLAGSYSGGLAMKAGVTACPPYSSSYPYLGWSIAGYDAREYNDTSKAANQWSVHEWNTKAFSTNLGINGQATVSLFTATLGGVSGKGVVCAALFDRYLVSGYPVDRLLGSTTYTLNSWPTSVKRLNFSFSLLDDTDVLAGHRLVLVLAVKSDSTSDLNFVYDHPTYPSMVEIATDTPA
jgi:prepilin-type N-terminal cleavage/methylation domain-containing protein